MKELNAQEAHDLMQSDPEYIYLDVRSVPEFEAGHAPRRSIFQSAFHAWSRNVSECRLHAVVEAALPKDAKLVVGCKSGGRVGPRVRNNESDGLYQRS